MAPYLCGLLCVVAMRIMCSLKSFRALHITQIFIQDTDGLAPSYLRFGHLTSRALFLGSAFYTTIYCTQLRKNPNKILLLEGRLSDSFSLVHS